MPAFAAEAFGADAPVPAPTPAPAAEAEAEAAPPAVEAAPPVQASAEAAAVATDTDVEMSMGDAGAVGVFLDGAPVVVRTTGARGKVCGSYKGAAGVQMYDVKVGSATPGVFRHLQYNHGELRPYVVDDDDVPSAGKMPSPHASPLGNGKRQAM